MASLFVSHSSQDAAKTEELVGRLRVGGFEGLFVDFDPDCGIPAGRNWERELYSQLRRANGVLYVATPASTASRWCFVELSLARSIGKPIFPVLIAGTERLGLLSDVQWVDVVAEGERAYGRLFEGLRRAGLDPADVFTWDPRRSPYPGLEPFGTQDAAVFFGRDVEINRLLQLLQPTLQHAAGRFVGIVGPSGSGKSSLLRAGLLPRLRRLPERWVVLPVFRPGQHPTNDLARALAEAFADRGQPFNWRELAERLERAPGELVELAGELAETGPGQPKVLVVVDQAEELVTRTGAHQQQRFLGLLDGALIDPSPLWVVATLRSEFLSRAPERAGLAEVIDDTLLVEPLSRNRLAEVIARPAQRAGLQFAPGLVERMVDETTGGDALPLLAYTLRELYQRVGREGTISIDDYAAIGGVVGALQRRADQLLDELGRRGQAQSVLPTLLKLVTVEGEAEPTRRRVRRPALSPDGQTVVQTFVEARLLTTDSDDHEAAVEVAHEALLRQWAPLREAIEEARSSLRLRSELERAVADWEQSERDESYLLRGGRLAAFEKWANSHADELTAPERGFLRASQVQWVEEQQLLREGRQISERKFVDYDAVLAYSHAVDGRLAPALQQGLHALGKPWYRRRALRVFCSQTNLTATPGLWDSIVRALEKARFLVLLASPAAAASPWVDREVAWWLAHKPRDRLLIALTDGDLMWDAAVGDFDWSVIHKALPPSLRGTFTQEPRWGDLKWARTAERVSLRDPRFQDAVADLAAPMHGVPKDDLLGEDVRLHRRAIQLVYVTLTIIVALALLASIATVVAIQQ